MGKVRVPTNPNGSVQQFRHLPRKDVWTFCQFRHRTCLHWCTFACHKGLLDRTSYCPRRYVHPPPEGWAQGQLRKIMLWRPQIWMLGLSSHSWQCYTHTKESQVHSIPCSTKYSQTIASVHRYDQFISCHVEKRSELLSLLTALTPKKIKYEWKDEHQKCFDTIKCVIGRKVLLDYTEFNAPF